MVSLDNIREYALQEQPDWSPFGHRSEVEAMPATHQEQFTFLNREAANYLHQLLVSSYLMTGDVWDPFKEGNFQRVDSFEALLPAEGERLKEQKKWLFNRGVPFATEVFVLPNFNDVPVLTTWKMVVNYPGLVFRTDDIAVFDRSTNWCLFCFHEGKLFFGRDKCFDPNATDDEMQRLNERKRQFPKFRHPYLPDDSAG